MLTKYVGLHVWGPHGGLNMWGYIRWAESLVDLGEPRRATPRATRDGRIVDSPIGKKSKNPSKLKKR